MGKGTVDVGSYPTIDFVDWVCVKCDDWLGQKESLCGEDSEWELIIKEKNNMKNLPIEFKFTLSNKEGENYETEFVYTAILRNDGYLVSWTDDDGYCQVEYDIFGVESLVNDGDWIILGAEK